MPINKRKILTYGTLALLTAVGVFIIVRRHKNKKTIQIINDRLDGKIADPNQVGQKIITATDLAKLPDGAFPLKIGDKNKKVYQVQQLLNKKFGAGIDLDGAYGDTTWKAMCKNMWNTSMLTTEATSCYEFHLGTPTRRMITYDDFNKLNTLSK